MITNCVIPDKVSYVYKNTEILQINDIGSGCTDKIKVNWYEVFNEKETPSQKQKTSYYDYTSRLEVTLDIPNTIKIDNKPIGGFKVGSTLGKNFLYKDNMAIDISNAILMEAIKTCGIKDEILQAEFIFVRFKGVKACSLIRHDSRAYKHFISLDELNKLKSIPVKNLVKGSIYLDKNNCAHVYMGCYKTYLTNSYYELNTGTKPLEDKIHLYKYLGYVDNVNEHIGCLSNIKSRYDISYQKTVKYVKKIGEVDFSESLITNFKSRMKKDFDKALNDALTLYNAQLISNNTWERHNAVQRYDASVIYAKNRYIELLHLTDPNEKAELLPEYK